MARVWPWLGGAAGVAAAAACGYLGLVTAAAPVDLGIGRRRRELGPLTVDIDADRDSVYELLAEPYLGRQTRAMAEKIQILERGPDMVLAAHRTHVRGKLYATTVETVRFTRPDRIDFRLVRGPVPEVTETFWLHERGPGTYLEYSGVLGTDLAAAGAWWGKLVARTWEQVVDDTFAAVAAEAERRAG